MTPAMRIRVQGIMYDIESAIDQEGRGRWLILEVSSIEEE
ncbi:head-tail adaptor protein [Oleidesulfovibrio alaskensis]|nr:head-tail adaptor protein [Oleidesulfovibrio alaskensis]